MSSILINNAGMLKGNAVKKGSVLIDDGKITKIAAHIKAPSDAQKIDAEGLVLFPGMVDMHVHLRDFDQAYKEDVVSGTAAAAAGGFCYVAAMPNSFPPVDSPEMIHALLVKAQLASANVIPVGSVTQCMKGEYLTDFFAMKEAGAGAVSEDGMPVKTASLMHEAMSSAQNNGLPILAHCEEKSLSRGGLMNEGEVSSRLQVKGCPAAAEDVAVSREIMLSADYGLPVHICHVSTARSVENIRRAKADGVPITCETAPHYFVFNHRALLSKDPNRRMSPPLRTESDRLAVIKGICDGTIDAIASDHAPHSAIEKSDFTTAPNGVIGLETSLAAAITFLVKPGYIDLSRLCELMCYNPARILKIEDYGLKEGNPANLTLFSETEKWNVDPRKFKSRSSNTPFAGMTLRGKVKFTLLNGKIVYKS